MWARCGCTFVAVKSLVMVVTVGKGVVANNGGCGNDNIMNCCSCLLSEHESEALPYWVVTQMPVGHIRHFEADYDILHSVIQMGIIFWQIYWGGSCFSHLCLHLLTCCTEIALLMNGWMVCGGNQASSSRPVPYIDFNSGI